MENILSLLLKLFGQSYKKQKKTLIVPVILVFGKTTPKNAPENVFNNESDTLFVFCKNAIFEHHKKHQKTRSKKIYRKKQNKPS